MAQEESSINFTVDAKFGIWTVEFVWLTMILESDM